MRVGSSSAAPMVLPWWDGGKMSPEFQAKIPPQFQTLFLGKAHWTREPRYRTLSQPADEKQYTLADGWWPDGNHDATG